MVLDFHLEISNQGMQREQGRGRRNFSSQLGQERRVAEDGLEREREVRKEGKT